MGTWQKHMLSFQATGLLASRVASQFLLMACKKKIMLYPVSKLKELSQLHLNFKLHNISMPSHMELDYSDHSGVGIFSSIETS